MFTRLSVCIMISMLLCAAAKAIVVDFDAVPSGTVLQGSDYAYSNRLSFSAEFRATDHTDWDWGRPHSGSNVLTSVEQLCPPIYPFVHLGYFTTHDYDPDPVQSVSAFFSTQTGAMVRVTAYRPGVSDFVPVVSTVIGAEGESWDNTRVELSTTPDLPFELIRFEGVNSPDDLTGFCLDDMTITLIPEPSSLLALAGGLAALGFLRRRK
jgi:hypothetical protein